MAESVVETRYGRVRGSERDGVVAFLGVPYGASTAGENRFRRPRPPAPWGGVRDAVELGKASPFTAIPMPGFDAAAGASLAVPADAVSEDCLTINVWTPSLDHARKLPVIVNMPHFAMGSPNGDLHTLASGGEAVAVSFGHRGGITGHLYLADIGGDEYAESGNAGTLDLVLALEWIRDNIAGFGGDPTRVMVYGCSGQGSEITMLSGVPEAAGLMHRALISEGFMHGLPRFFASMMADRVLARLGIGHNELHKLHELPWQQLHEAAAPPSDLATSLTAPLPFQAWWQFYPVIDGVVLPAASYADRCPAQSTEVPTIFSYALDSLDMINSTRPWVGRLDDIGLMIIAENHVGRELAKDIVAAERRNRPDASPTELALSLINHRTMFSHCTRIAEARLVGATAPTWVYRWDYKAALPKGLRSAVHGGEFGFMLNNVDGGAFSRPMFANLYEGRDDRYELQAVLHESFLHFAHDGNPGTKAMPAWPTYDLAKRSTMLLDSVCTVAEDPESELRQLYAHVDYRAGETDYRDSLISEGFVS
jgi:para-nitrobenzyl esterase